jgi:hypothetical protein
VQAVVRYTELSELGAERVDHGRWPAHEDVLAREVTRCGAHVAGRQKPERIGADGYDAQRRLAVAMVYSSSRNTAVSASSVA